MKVLAGQDSKINLSENGINTTNTDVPDSENPHCVEISDIEKEDVKIICEKDVIILRNREKLSSLSDYFRALLRGNFRENAQNCVHLSYVDADLLQLLLDFYDKYQSKIRRRDDDNFCRVFIKDVNTVWLLIELADMLNLEQAATECDKYVIQTLKLDNCYEVCNLAERYSRSDIELESVRKWIVEEKLANNPFTTESHCKEKCSDESCMCVFTTKYKQIHKFYILGGFFYGYFRECDVVETDVILVESSSDDELEKTQETSTVRREIEFKPRSSFPGSHNEECRIASLGSDIYVTGGFDEHAKALAQVWKYNTRLDEWNRIPDLRHSRFYHCIASVGEHLYVCGGYDDNFVLDSLERYHPHYNEWVDMSKMLTGVGNAAFSNDDYGIYVLCGQYGYKEVQTTNTVQYYSISADQWTLLTHYNSPVFYPHSEYGLSTMMLNGKIYVVGGQTERCDAYDIDKDEWTRVCDMMCRRMEAAVIQYNGKIYVAGGYDYRTGQYQDTIEEYDPRKNKWKILQTKLPRPARSIGFCHIFDVEKL